MLVGSTKELQLFSTIILLKESCLTRTNLSIGQTNPSMVIITKELSNSLVLKEQGNVDHTYYRTIILLVVK